VAQRRRRVFVVGYLGDWRVAAAVLFERESLQGNTKPSRKKREEVTSDAEGSVGEAGDAQPIAFNERQQAQTVTENCANTLSATDYKGVQCVAQPIAFKVRGGCEGGGKGYLGQEEQAFTISTMQDQQIAQPLYYESHPQDSRVNGPKDVADTVSATYGTGGGNTPLVQQPIAVDTYNQTISEHTSQTIGSSASDVNHYGAVLHSMAIRRLTPKEAERLQGFPDDWTKIPYRNKEADQCPDGPRYKACGNSMAVPVMRWIGERINLIESIL
jgi:DNA (cytosine-5)-methyltransferase 1